jgi:hypothetical protein
MKKFKKFVDDNSEILPLYSKDLKISVKKNKTNDVVFGYFSDNNTKADRIIHFYKPISKTINFNEL